MLSSASGRPTSADEARGGQQQNGGLLSRRIWLPKLLYKALPWFYVSSGLAAFLATLYINQWFWILPHYVLFSIACGHLGIYVFRLRRQIESNEA